MHMQNSIIQHLKGPDPVQLAWGCITATLDSLSCIEIFLYNNVSNRKRNTYLKDFSKHHENHEIFNL